MINVFKKKEKVTKKLIVLDYTGTTKVITNPKKFALWKALCKSEGLSGYSPTLLKEVKE